MLWPTKPGFSSVELLQLETAPLPAHFHPPFLLSMRHDLIQTCFLNGAGAIRHMLHGVRVGSLTALLNICLLGLPRKD